MLKAQSGIPARVPRQTLNGPQPGTKQRRGVNSDGPAILPHFHDARMAGHGPGNFEAGTNAGRRCGCDGCGEISRHDGLACFIVADNARFRDEARGLLEDQGIEVVGTAASAHQALQQVAGLAADVALVDIDLGGESGFELASRLRSGVTTALRIILISTHDEREYADLSRPALRSASLRNRSFGAGNPPCSRVRRCREGRQLEQLVGIEEREHRQHAAAVVVRLGEAEFAHDACACFSTVPLVSQRRLAMPAWIRPSAINATTSRSRRVKSSSGSSLVRAATSSRTSDGSTTELPRQTRSTEGGHREAERDGPELQPVVVTSEVAGHLARGIGGGRGHLLPGPVHRPPERRAWSSAALRPSRASNYGMPRRLARGLAETRRRLRA